MTQYEIALKRENEKLQQEVDLMRSIGTRDAFYHYYYTICNKYKTREEAFSFLNEKYFQLFNGYLFPNYECFRKYTHRKIK